VRAPMSFKIYLYCVIKLNKKENKVRFLNKYIRPGHKNMVSLSVSKISASEDIRSIAPEDRNCHFPDENQMLQMHKSYSQSNCFLECYLFNAQINMAQDYNMTYNCTPWFLPFQEHSQVFCDPWEALILSKMMFKSNYKDKCLHCLPDCTTVNYHPTFQSVPFRYAFEIILERSLNLPTDLALFNLI
jgi:hypothetical protein